ncbi:MAG: hypothetical protein HOA17_01940 [Candidatus Melainabacteria bacterium]|jgi:hypothetical protein|nr:hypothetical protein [Candidatus Melainabacteria bacterium]
MTQFPVKAAFSLIHSSFLGTTANVLEDGMGLMNTSEMGGAGSIIDGLKGGEQYTKIGYIIEMARDIALSFAPPPIKILLCLPLATMEWAGGDTSNALSLLSMSLFPIMGNKFVKASIKRIAKAFTENGLKAGLNTTGRCARVHFRFGAKPLLDGLKGKAYKAKQAAKPHTMPLAKATNRQASVNLAA